MKIYSYILSIRDLVLTFKFVVCFEITFVHGVRQGFNFILLYVDIQLSQPLLKSYFPH